MLQTTSTKLLTRSCGGHTLRLHPRQLGIVGPGSRRTRHSPPAQLVERVLPGGAPGQNRSMAKAARWPSPIASTSVAGPRTTSPPANTLGLAVR